MKRASKVLITNSTLRCQGHASPLEFSSTSAVEQQLDEMAQPKKKESLQIYPPPTDLLPTFLREKYEEEAKKCWDLFYKRNANKFFKDRHYLDKEWGIYFQTEVPFLHDRSARIAASQGLRDKTVVLEVGCGVGNSVFPLLASYPNMFVYACDFSARAINFVKDHSEYTEKRIHAFVCDVTHEDLASVIPAASVDVTTLVFVLSAISPEKMSQVLQNIRTVMKPNGYVLVRDYAAGDLAQERLSSKMQKISENFYARGDGTRAFFFTKAGLCDLFEKEGFACETVTIYEKKVENRAKEIVMDRRWIRGAFHLMDAPCADGTGSRGFDVDLTEDLAGGLFGMLHLEVTPVELEGYLFNIQCVSKENQHSCNATGLMMWESGQVLATLLARNRGVMASKTLLELGCGSAGLCSMVGAMEADLVVATDGDNDVIRLLSDNVASNSHLIPVNKLITHVLKWGCLHQLQSVKELTNGRGFDVIVGTDVAYISEAVPSLFATAKFLLAEGAIGKQEPLVLLCNVVRQVDEAFVIDIAERNGFSLADWWPPCDDNGNNYVLSSRIVEKLFPCGLDEISDICGLARILCFRKIARL